MSAGMFAAAVACYAFLFDGLIPSVSEPETRCAWFESFHDGFSGRELLVRLYPVTSAAVELRREWAERLGLVLTLDGPIDQLTAPGVLQV